MQVDVNSILSFVDKIKFRKPPKRTTDTNELHVASKKKKNAPKSSGSSSKGSNRPAVNNKKLLSFDDEDAGDDT